MKKANHKRSGIELESKDTDPIKNDHYGEDGVDITLIRWMLSLTPRERIQVLQGHLKSIHRIKQSGKFI